MAPRALLASLSVRGGLSEVTDDDVVLCYINVLKPVG